MVDKTAISMSFSQDPDLPQLPADYEEIKRAFLHIIKTSYGALSEKGGDLAVETHFSPTPLPGYIIVAVIAKGPEVAREDLAQKALPFHGWPRQGKGLGVAIGRRIIAEHCRGNLQAERVAGAGLRLMVSLPVAGVQGLKPINQDSAF